jgi:multidrug resistance efflux pump
VNRRVKKYIKRIGIAAACAAVAAGVLTRLRVRAGGAVQVLPVSMMSGPAETLMFTGVVNASPSQNVKLKDAMVRSVNVTAGDTVKKGDVLMEYDTTSFALTVQADEAKIAVLEADLDRQKRRLEQVRGLKPSESAPLQADPAPSSTEEGGNDRKKDMPPLVTESSLDEKKAGSREVFQVTTQTVVSAGFLQKLQQTASCARLDVFEGNVYYGTWILDGAALAGTAEINGGSYRPLSGQEKDALADEIARDILSGAAGDQTPGQTAPAEPSSQPSQVSSTPQSSQTQPDQTVPSSQTSQPATQAAAETDEEALSGRIRQILESSGLGIVQDPVSSETAFQDWKLADSMQITEQGAVIRSGSGYGVFQASAPIPYEEYAAADGGYETEAADALPVTGTEDAGPADTSDENYVYTQAELASLIKQSQKTIQDTDLQLRQARITLEQDRETKKDGLVKAQSDGVVKEVKDYRAVSPGDTVITVAGDSGYEITAYVDELSVTGLSAGDAAQITDYSTGSTMSGSILSISDRPADENMGYEVYGVNPNSSYYPVTIAAEDTKEALDKASRCGVTFAMQESPALVIESMYVRSDDGGKYVMLAGEDGRLEKRYVKTGRTIYNYQVEILDGLSAEDYIAFPYGSNVTEGAKAERMDMSDLYGGIY